MRKINEQPKMMIHLVCNKNKNKKQKKKNKEKNSRKKRTCRFKDLSRVKPGFESVPPQFYFEIAGLDIAIKWRKIQNIDEEERF